MKIAFINPPFLAHYSRGQRSPGVTKAGTLYYPYWLAYAAGWAQKNGFKISLFDFVASKSTHSSALRKLERVNPDLAVVETSTPSIENDFKFIGKLKEALPRVFILLVGTHVSALPEWSLKKANGVDAVGLGEYDQIVVDLAKALVVKKAWQKTRGLAFYQARKFKVNPKPKPIENLDDFPFVSQVYQQFLVLSDYYFAAADYPMVMIISGRGCPFGCFFCLYPQLMHGFKYRFRSPKSVAAEFEYIQKNLPEVKEVIIEDDTFTANLARVRTICRLLIKRGNSLKWSTNARVHLDLKTMKLMKEAGCRLLIVGYESGSQLILDQIGKKIRIADSLRFAKNAKKAGLLVHGCFMVGNPGETPETMRQTFNFAKKLNPDSVQFYPLFVYPGTRAYDWAQKKGLLKTKDFRRWLDKKGGHLPVIDLPGLSAQQMVEFCNQAYRRFHLRPFYLLKKLVQLFKEPEEGKRSLRSGLNYLKGAYFNEERKN